MNAQDKFNYISVLVMVVTFAIAFVASLMGWV